MKLILLLLTGCLSATVSTEPANITLDIGRPCITEGLANYLSTSDLMKVAATKRNLKASMQPVIDHRREAFRQEKDDLIQYLAESFQRGIDESTKSAIQARVQGFSDKYFDLLNIDLSITERSGRFDSSCSTQPLHLRETYIGRKVTWKTMKVGDCEILLTDDGQKLAGFYHQFTRLPAELQDELQDSFREV